MPASGTAVSSRPDPVHQFDLSGQIALVTGSSRGIGRTLAGGLAAAGASVVLNGLDPIRLDQTRGELRARYGEDRIYASPFDITAEDQVAGAVTSIEADVGPIRILVNNAGIQHRVSMLDLELADWRRVLEHNLTSAFIVGRAVARGMIARGGGKIINIGSVQSDLARPTIAPYTASKGGLRNLTRAMAAEWARAGIQANSIAPGYIRTEMTQKLVDDAAFNAWVVDRTPAARWGSSAELVGPVIWLASAASSYVNGQTIFVDGGMTAVV
jgi:gluconate 5-dehydrogenase